MYGDEIGAGASRPERKPLKTHEFGWDPLETAKLAAGRLSSAFRLLPKRALIALGAVAISAAALAGASLVSAGGSDAQTAMTPREKSLADREAQLRQREDRVAELERRRTSSESEIWDSEKRIAELESRRADLQRQVAELTAPVSPGGGDFGDAPSEGADRKAAIDDPSPPDEMADAHSAISARSRDDDRGIEPSTGRVDGHDSIASAADGLQAAAVAASPAGLVRVYIHVRSADAAARGRAEAVAAELRRRGVEVAQIRGVSRPVKRDAVRFYYDEDREAVAALQDAVRQASSPGESAPQRQDFRGYRAPPKPGTLELWLS